MVTRESIFAAEDIKLIKVDVPEWGGEVFIRPFSSRDRDKFESAFASKDKGATDNIRARAAVACCCDAAGARIFQVGDEVKLGEKSGNVLSRIFKVIMDVNKFTEEDVEVAGKN